MIIPTIRLVLALLLLLLLLLPEPRGRPFDSIDGSAKVLINK